MLERDCRARSRSALGKIDVAGAVLFVADVALVFQMRSSARTAE
jgi:hypothetical protein